MKVCGIYIIKSLISWKCYIGQSTDVFKRFKHHKNALSGLYHTNVHLQRFVNKNGLQFLSFELLERCDYEQLNEREVFWIKEYSKYWNCFNLTEGADDNPMNNPENRKAVSRALKGRKKSKEWVAKIAANTDKSKNIDAKIKSGLIKYVYAYNSKDGSLAHSCFGYKMMADHFRINESNIRQCINGQLKTVNGIHFSLFELSIDGVKAAIMPKYTPEQRSVMAKEYFKENGHPSFGKKRPDIAGDNNPFSKMIKAGYKVPIRIKIPYDEVISLYKKGNTQKQVAAIAGCTQAQISTILRSNNIFKFKRKASVETPAHFLTTNENTN